jgi:tetratricopeptide (TPR) repeat protein
MITKWIVHILLVVCVFLTSILYVGKWLDNITFALVITGSAAFLIVNILEIKSIHEKELKKIITEAEALYKDRQPQNALNMFNRALKLSPSSMEVNLGRAQCNRLLMQFDEALNDCKNAMRFHSNSVQPLYLSGLILLQAHKLNEALTSFRSVEKMDPEFSDTYYMIGQIHEKMCNLQDAEIYYQKCANKDSHLKEEAIAKLVEVQVKIAAEIKAKNEIKAIANRRQHFRTPFVSIVEILLNDKEEIIALLVDLSAGGGRIMTGENIPLSFGDEIRMIINLPNRLEVSVHGDIVWSKKIDGYKRYNFGFKHIGGIQFREPNPEISKFVDWSISN